MNSAAERLRKGIAALGLSVASVSRSPGVTHRALQSVLTGRTPGIYQLKRRAISRMLAGGLDVATIASITGHRTPAGLLTYARTNEDRQRAALAVLDGHHERAGV